MTPNFIILSVKDPIASAAFYERHLGCPAIDTAPTFAMLKLNDSTMLGLWSAATMKPQPSGSAGSTEIAVTVETRGDVDRLHTGWSDDGVAILQTPEAVDFGYTFTGVDPDGHRLRVFVPENR